MIMVIISEFLNHVCKYMSQYQKCNMYEQNTERDTVNPKNGGVQIITWSVLLECSIIHIPYSSLNLSHGTCPMRYFGHFVEFIHY